MKMLAATVVYGDRKFDANCEIVAEPGKIKIVITNVMLEPFFMSVQFGVETLMDAIDAAMEESNQEKED